MQGTPDSKTGAENSSLAAAVDKDGKPLPAPVDKDGKPLPGSVDPKDTPKGEAGKGSKAQKPEPVYKPPRPLKSKYHIQVIHHVTAT